LRRLGPTIELYLRAQCPRGSGLGAWAKSCARGAHAVRQSRRFCPPSYVVFGVKRPEGLGLGRTVWLSGGARSHAQRSAPPRSGCARTGFRSLLRLTASPHIRSGVARTHIPHACGEEAIERMRSIYESGCVFGPRVARSSSILHRPRLGRPQRRRSLNYASMIAPSGTSPVVR